MPPEHGFSCVLKLVVGVAWLFIAVAALPLGLIALAALL